MMPVSGSYEQHAAVEAAEKWTAAQAARLGVDYAFVMAAIKRGWTAWDVECVGDKNARKMKGEPLPPGDLAAGIKRIRNAPILPINLGYSTRRRLRR